jgi:hypothetical protein
VCARALLLIDYVASDRGGVLRRNGLAVWVFLPDGLAHKVLLT